MTAPTTRYVRAGDVRLAHQIFGDGPRDLLLSPGLNAVDVMWEEPSFARFLDRLASFARVICYDRRGTGVSDPVPLAGMPTLEAWTDEMDAVLDAIDAPQVAILGWEVGGMIAALFAAAHPERVSALLLVNSLPRVTATDDYPWGPPRDAAQRAVEEAAETWGCGDTLDRHAPRLADDRALKRWYGRLERFGISPTTRLAVREMLAESDVRPALAAIRVPTLILHRDRDPWVSVGHGRFLSTHIPGATYEELPGEEHPPYFGDQDAILRRVAAFLTGVPSTLAPDRMLATVMFTDIVGSTGNVARVGDLRWRELLDAHDRATRYELEQHRGKLIKTTGDGVLATFDGPARAVRCAAALRSALGGLSLGIRVGLHTGEVEVRGPDIGGIAVHIASRIQALANPGEILTSGVVPPLVAGSGIEFTDRGEHELRDVPGTWQLFAAHV
jgi:pimeloyl-ACP methyl ester carboxylesterase